MAATAVISIWVLHLLYCIGPDVSTPAVAIAVMACLNALACACDPGQLNQMVHKVCLAVRAVSAAEEGWCLGLAADTHQRQRLCQQQLPLQRQRQRQMQRHTSMGEMGGVAGPAASWLTPLKPQMCCGNEQTIADTHVSGVV